MTAKVVTLDSRLNAATATRFFALEVLRLNDGDRARAAAALDVDAGTLRKWMTQLQAQGVVVPKAKMGRPINPVGRGKVRVHVPLGMTG